MALFHPGYQTGTSGQPIVSYIKPIYGGYGHTYYNFRNQYHGSLCSFWYFKYKVGDKYLKCALVKKILR